MNETLYTASAAARKLGISRQRVIEKATIRQLGQRPTRGVWLFSDDDLSKLATPGKPGRPHK